MTTEEEALYYICEDLFNALKFYADPNNLEQFFRIEDDGEVTDAWMEDQISDKAKETIEKWSASGRIKKTI